MVAAFALIAPCAAAADFVFSITEGVTYYQTNREIQARFQPLADLLAKALKRPVRMVVVSPYNDLREGLAKQEYDLSFIHPAHVSLAAIKSGQYHSVAWTTGFTDYSVYLLINKDQPYTKFDDLQGPHGRQSRSGFDHRGNAAGDAARPEARRRPTSR